MNGTIFKDFIDILYPSLCVCCENALTYGEKDICIHCFIDLPSIETKDPISENQPSLKNLWGRCYCQGGFSLFYFSKKSKVQKILHAIKYKKHKQLAVDLGIRLGDKIVLEFKEEIKSKIDIIIPIPMHKHKLTERGYNQALLIAEGISKQTNIPLNTEILHRTKKGTTQTIKGRMERFISVNEIYKINTKENLCDKNILLVDDILTTGATFDSCINELKKNKVKNIYIASIAISTLNQ